MAAAAPTAAPARAKQPGDDGRTGRVAAMIASYAALIALTLLFVLPLIWMLSTAFKTNQEATRIEPTWIPENPSSDGFDAILNTGEQTLQAKVGDFDRCLFAPDGR